MTFFHPDFIKDHRSTINYKQQVGLRNQLNVVAVRPFDPRLITSAIFNKIPDLALAGLNQDNSYDRLVNRTKFLNNLISETFTSKQGDMPWVSFDMGTSKNVTKFLLKAYQSTTNYHNLLMAKTKRIYPVGSSSCSNLGFSCSRHFHFYLVCS